MRFKTTILLLEQISLTPSLSQPFVFREAACSDAHAMHSAVGMIIPRIQHVSHIADQQLSRVFGGTRAGDGGPEGGGDGVDGRGC